MPKTEPVDTGTDDNLPPTDNELVEQMAGMLEGALDEDEQEGAEEDAEQPPAQPKDDQEADEREEEDDGQEQDEAEDAGEDEGDEEEELKVSIRINGKKADLGELLEQTTHYPVVGGEELEVGYKELIDGYQRGKDYAEKTSELKKIKGELQPYAQMVAYAKHDPQFQQYIQHYFQYGPNPEVANNPNLQVSDMELAEMMDDNSDKYDPQRANEVIKARKEYLSAQQGRQEITQKAQHEMQAQYQEWADAEAEKAEELVAQMGGDLQNEAGELVSHLRELGFKDEEIKSLADSRLVVAAWEASQFRKMKASADSPKPRLGAKRKKLAAPRVAKGGGKGKKEQSSKRRQRDTFRKAMSTQNEEDWVSAVASKLNL